MPATIVILSLTHVCKHLLYAHFFYYKANYNIVHLAQLLFDVEIYIDSKNCEKLRQTTTCEMNR